MKEFIVLAIVTIIAGLVSLLVRVGFIYLAYRMVRFVYKWFPLILILLILVAVLAFWIFGEAQPERL